MSTSPDDVLRDATRHGYIAATTYGEPVVTHLDSGPRDISPLCGANSSEVTNEIEEVTCATCEHMHAAICAL